TPPAGADPAPGIANLLRCARSNVARRKVAIARILPLQIVVAIRLGNRLRPLAAILFALRHPDPAIIAQRLGHEGELGLMVATDGDARGMNLRVARIGEKRALLVGAVRRGDIAADGV